MTDNEVKNPPAFPMGNPEQGGYDGMTLRDYFAGQALAGMGVFMPSENGHITGPVGAKLRAEWAYMQADAMLKARDQ